MDLQTLQSIVLFTGLGFMFAQLLVKNKQTSHTLFAIFCGSVAMSVAKDMSGNTIGAYQYLIGMAACATCNCYWLLSRSLFRGKNSISIHHLILAAVIALLIMLNQGYLFASHAQLVDATVTTPAQVFLREVTVLLSSCILVLSFWEGCRGLSSVSQQEKAQRILFLFTFGGAVAMAKMMQGLYAGDAMTQKIAITCITLFVLINTQILMFWRFKSTPSEQVAAPSAVPLKTTQPQNSFPQSLNHKPECASIAPTGVEESQLASRIKELIVDQSLFLQPNLKIADIARKLDVPEYRVSNALRHNLNARNFNQYVNELRIKHAQTLLRDADKCKWSVLVVSMESGFASVGPFTRAFKAMTGCTPNQYRQRLNQAESA